MFHLSFFFRFEHLKLNPYVYLYPSNVTLDISLHEVCVQVGVGYVIAKFSRMDSLPNVLTHGAPLAGESSAITRKYP